MITGGTRRETLGRPCVIEARIGSVVATTDRQLFTKEAIESVTQNYFDKSGDSPIPPVFDVCKNIITNNIKGNNLVVFIFLEDRPIGALIARKGASEITDARFLQQTFFNTCVTGAAAVKAVWAAHRVLLKYARLHDYSYGVSPGNSADGSNTFNRILAKDGWHSQGYLSVFNTKE